MPTIVVYTEDKKAVKMTRDRIVSPFPSDLKDGARIRPAAAAGAAK